MFYPVINYVFNRHYPLYNDDYTSPATKLDPSFSLLTSKIRNEVNNTEKYFMEVSFLVIGTQNDKLTYVKHELNYDIWIWEFENFQNLTLEDVIVQQDMSIKEKAMISKDTYKGLTVFNSGTKYEQFWDTIFCEYNLQFENKLYINLSSYSKIDRIIDETSYKGFIGNVSKLSLSSDAVGNEKVFYYPYFSQDSKNVSLVLFSKKHNSLIVVNKLDGNSIRDLDEFLDINKL